MNVYIVMYDHRHGTDAWPVFVRKGETAPTEESEIDKLEDFEPDRDESVRVTGPFPVPRK